MTSHIIEKRVMHEILGIRKWDFCPIITGPQKIHDGKTFYVGANIESNLRSFFKLLLFQKSYIIKNKTSKIETTISIDELRKKIDGDGKSVAYVYFLINKNEIVYIGSTHGDLRLRIHDHIRGKKGNEPKEFDSMFLIKTVVDNVDIIEKAYIYKFCPPLNREVKPNIFIIGLENLMEIVKEKSIYCQ